MNTNRRVIDKNQRLMWAKRCVGRIIEEEGESPFFVAVIGGYSHQARCVVYAHTEELEAKRHALKLSKQVKNVCADEEDFCSTFLLAQGSKKLRQVGRG